MTWSVSQKRWLKKWRGKMYSVSPKQLNMPPTKEQSREAANDWWEQKQATLVLAAPAENDAFSDMKRQRDWYRRHEDEKAAESIDRAIAWIKEEAKRTGTPETLYTSFSSLHPDPNETIWADRFAHAKATDSKQSAAALIDQYLTLKRASTRVGGISAKRADSLRLHLGAFREWFGRDRAVDEIDEKAWSGSAVSTNIGFKNPSTLCNARKTRANGRLVYTSCSESLGTGVPWQRNTPLISPSENLFTRLPAVFRSFPKLRVLNVV
jgi:hypothetical protein